MRFSTFTICLAIAFVWASVALAEGNVIINEVQSSNGETLKDQTGEYSDWIELYNDGNAAVDLSGWGLSDKKKKPYKWTFPEGTTIAAGAYLVVIADEEDKVVNGEIHAGIKLSADGEDLTLTRPEVEAPAGPQDAFSFGKMPQDASAGRGSAGGVAYYLKPTPGTANDAEEYGPPCEDVVFSIGRGLYETPISLTLSCSDREAEIRYTLDHSTPSATQGLVFTGEPIRIEKTTAVRAVAVKPRALPARTSITHTYLFPAQVADQTKPEIAPETWSDKAYLSDYVATIPSSYAPSANVLKDDVANARFIAALKALPTLALTTDDAGLFHPTEGIYCKPYTLGDVERRVAMEWIAGAASFGIDAGLKIHGASSRHFDVTPKKTFRLKFRGEYGTSKLDQKILADGGCTRKGFNDLVLRGENNESWHCRNGVEKGTNFKDQLFRDLQQTISGYSLGGTFAHLYLNGLYWGIYNVTERGNADTAANIFGGKASDWTTAKLHEIDEGDGTEYRAFMNNAWYHPDTLAYAGTYSNVCEKVAIGDFIDYMILEYWSANTDWPHNNVIGVGATKAGHPWRWFVWDSEFALSDINADRMPTTRYINGPENLHHGLMHNAEYRWRFAHRAEELFATGAPLSNESVSNHVARLAVRLRPAIFAESARWGAYVHDYKNSTRPIFGIDHWEAEVTRLSSTALTQRYPVFVASLKNAELHVSQTPENCPELVPTPLPTPPPPPPPTKNNVIWTVPVGYVPKDDLPWVSGFTCMGENLSVTVKGLVPGESCGIKVAGSLSELKTATTVSATSDGEEVTISVAVPEHADSLFIQVQP